MAKIRLMALLAGLFFFFPPSVHSQGIPAGKWWRNPDVARKLGLSKHEINRLEEAYVRSRRQLIRSKGELEAERFELETLFGRNNFNETAAKKQFERLEQKRTSLSKSRFQFVVEVRKILGPRRFQELVDYYRRKPPRPSFPKGPGKAHEMKP